MNYRNLGSTGLKVSELGLGCSSLGNSVFNYGDEKDFLDILNYAFESGINFFDTANTYAFGNSEELIGKALKSKRDKIIISTKGGAIPSKLSLRSKALIPLFGSTRRLIKPFKKKLKNLGKKRQDFSTQHLLEAIEKSLVRLQTDYIDVYMLHNPSSDIIKEGEVFSVLDKLKAEGKLRFYGVSAGSIDDAILCLKFPGVSVLQIEFNLLDQSAAKNLFPLLEKNHAGIVIKIPLARGVLTKKGRVNTGHYLAHKTLSDKQKFGIQKITSEINKEIFPEAAFRFILEHKEVSTIIAGTKSAEHLKRNISILSSPAIADAELKKIYALFNGEDNSR